MVVAKRTRLHSCRCPSFFICGGDDNSQQESVGAKSVWTWSNSNETQRAHFSSNGNSVPINHGALEFERTRTRAARREGVAAPVGNYWHRIQKHYHTGQVVFYILEGIMVVQHEDGSRMTLKAGDSLLIKPGTVHAHWNASSAVPLVFTEFIIVDEGQRTAVFVE